MSNSFANSTTSKIQNVEREVEMRLARISGFNEDFSDGTLPTKERPFQKSHDDFTPRTDPAFRVQKSMDEIDMVEHLMNCGIKKPSDQFPGVETEPKQRHLSFDEKVEKKLASFNMRKRIEGHCQDKKISNVSIKAGENDFVVTCANEQDAKELRTPLEHDNMLTNVKLNGKKISGQVHPDFE